MRARISISVPRHSTSARASAAWTGPGANRSSPNASADSIPTGVGDAVEVHAAQPVPVFGRVIEEVPDQADARGVDQHIDRSQLVRKRAERLGVGDVALSRGRVAPAPLSGPLRRPQVDVDRRRPSRRRG
jgi:hypothetical protein